MTQKLSHKPVDPVTGFQELDLSKMDRANPSALSDFSVSKPIASPFEVSQSFWEWLSADPELKKEFERRIESLAEARMQSLLEAEKEKAAKLGYQAGLNLGREEGHKSVAEAELKLNELCKSILAQKSKILLDHQKEWMRAFSKLLERFLVPNRELALDKIGDWIKEGLGTFEKTGRVNLYFSPADYELVKANIHSGQAGETSWEVLEDPSLAAGEVRCESERGGMIFSAPEQMKELELWIERFSHGDSAA